MIYTDGDSCMYGSGIGQEIYGYTEYYTGREALQRFRDGSFQQVNTDMHKQRLKHTKIANNDSLYIEKNNVSAQLKDKGIDIKTGSYGGSSNQAVASRIVNAVIEDNIKTVIFCPTSLMRIIYPKDRSQSLTFGSASFSNEYRLYIKKWTKVFSTNQTKYLDTNALLGLISFCKDNNVELLGVKTLVWQSSILNVNHSKEIQRIIDQVNELCVFDMGSDLDDNEKRIYTACGHPNLECHTKLAEDICTHLKT